MSEKISLREIEQKIFRTTMNDGLLDIFLGCFFLIFVIAPFLSTRLGDFWSSLIFVPFWGLVFLILWVVRKRVVTPRIGQVAYGKPRKARLKRFSLIMLAINIIAFIGGLVAAFSTDLLSGRMYSYFIGLLFLSAFSLAAFFLNLNRLYFYGLLVGFAPLVGEWLWSRELVSHHGFPVTFGTVSGIMILVGLTLLIQLVRDNPAPAGELPFKEA
jgi:hypothetical protein